MTAAAAAVCIAFYRHPGWGRGRAKGGFVREGNEGPGRRGRDRTQTQPFFSALLHRSSPKHPLPPSTTAGLSLPALPPSRRAAVTLVSSPSHQPPRPYTPPRATSLLHIYIHTRTRTSTFLLVPSPGGVYWTQFFSYFGSSFKVGGYPNSFCFLSRPPVSNGTVIRRHDPHIEIMGRLFFAERRTLRSEKKCKYYVRSPVPLGNNVSTLRVEWAPR